MGKMILNGKEYAGGSSLDTDISNPTDGQVLTYDSQTGKWVNADSGGGIYPFSVVDGKVCITYQQEVE